MMIPIIEV